MAHHRRRNIVTNGVPKAMADFIIQRNEINHTRRLKRFAKRLRRYVKISPNIPLVPSSFNWEKLAEILEFCRRQSAAPTVTDAWKFHAALNL